MKKNLKFSWLFHKPKAYYYNGSNWPPYFI